MAIFPTQPTQTLRAADFDAISKRLSHRGGIVPGFIAPQRGMFDRIALTYAKGVEGWTFCLLPDRNLVSRMASVAQHGRPIRDDGPTSMAIELMAFCQAIDIQIEPSVAFHELAHREGNLTAQEELRWFRLADRENPSAWIDLALGRRDSIVLGEPPPRTDEDLAFPLARWRRNYIVALKVGELELSPLQPVEKARELLRWMYEEFMLAGPGAAFALFYLAPRGPRRGLIKRLRSVERTEAIAGIKNAAWDITQLSDFSARIQRGEAERRRYLFATADQGLARIAPAIISTPEPQEDLPYVRALLTEGWGESLAAELSNLLVKYVAQDSSPTRPAPDPRPDFISICIVEGERRMLDWTA